MSKKEKKKALGAGGAAELLASSGSGFLSFSDFAGGFGNNSFGGFKTDGASGGGFADPGSIAFATASDSVRETILCHHNNRKCSVS